MKRILTVTFAIMFALCGLTATSSAEHLDGISPLTLRDNTPSGCTLFFDTVNRVKNDGDPAVRFVRVRSHLSCDSAYARGHWSVVIHGGTSYEHPHDWHYGKAHYQTRFDNITTGRTNLVARIKCNYKVDGSWAMPTTKMSIYHWAEVHSPVKTTKDNWYRGSQQDWEIDNVTC